MALAQIKRLTGTIERVPREDGEPVIELHLEPHQQVVSVKLTPQVDRVDRVTVDWRWTVFVVSRLGEAVA